MNYCSNLMSPNPVIFYQTRISNEGDEPFGTYSVSAKSKIPKNYDPKADHCHKSEVINHDFTRRKKIGIYTPNRREVLSPPSLKKNCSPGSLRPSGKRIWEHWRQRTRSGSPLKRASRLSMRNVKAEDDYADDESSSFESEGGSPLDELSPAELKAVASPAPSRPATPATSAV